MGWNVTFQISILLALVCSDVVGFAVKPPGCITRTPKSPILLEAYYYGMDPPGEEEQESDIFSKDDNPYQTTSSSQQTLVNLNSDHARLARVAATHPPPGHALDLRNIADINVLEVDDTHIELQATVCEEESCAAVAFPVLFPHPCGGSDGMMNQNECVLENIEELDHEAELLLKQAEWEAANYEVHEAMKRQRLEMLDHGHVTFPHWWVVPTSDSFPGMLEECETMRNILNSGDFQAEIRSVAQLGLTYPQAVVEEATVSAVGPAGIILRARLQGGGVQEIPVSFPHSAGNIDQLRDLVEEAMNH